VYKGGRGVEEGKRRERERVRVRIENMEMASFDT
jgi:hypothetical protein